MLKLVACAFPYIIPVVPRLLPIELIEGEHFVLADLCKSSPGRSSRVVAPQEDQAEAATGALVRFVQVTQPQSPWLAPKPEKKEPDRKRARQTKVVDAKLEGFVDWTSILASEPVEKKEMSMLAARFAAHVPKRVADSEDESTPISNGKHSGRSSSDEEAQKDWAIIPVDSPNGATNDQPVLEGTPGGVTTPLEEGVPTRGPSNVDEIREGSPSRVVVTSLPPPRPTDTVPSKRRSLDQVMLSMYIPPYEMIHPPTGMVALDLEGAREIIHRWSPFNQAKPPVAHKHDLYPNYFRVPMAARAE